MSSFSAGHGRRLKKKLYHRGPGLDKAMDLQKKQLSSFDSVSSSWPKRQVRCSYMTLKRRLALSKKLNFVSLIERHPDIFGVSGGSISREPIADTLTEKARNISSGEIQAQELITEPNLGKKSDELLMMSMDCQIPLEKIELIQSELGLPKNFKNKLIPSYPDFF